jgi:uncharacterized protein GlcG (DUF336 family)
MRVLRVSIPRNSHTVAQGQCSGSGSCRAVFWILEEMHVPAISLEMAGNVIAGAFEKARELGLKPLSVVVVDAGGHPIAFARQDGGSFHRFAIASAKAAGALAMGISSRAIAEMAEQRPTFVNAAGSLAQYGILPAAGGIIIVDAERAPIGAVGVTGDTSDNDEICALHAIEFAGLLAQ